MKRSELLKAVLFMNETENQGTFKLDKKNGDMCSQLEWKFGPIDWENSAIEGLEFDKEYFYSYVLLCSEETLSWQGEQRHYDVPYLLESVDDYGEVYIYDIED